eukprot:2753086-Rhodomonas_salina.3
MAARPPQKRSAAAAISSDAGTGEGQDSEDLCDQVVVHVNVGYRPRAPAARTAPRRPASGTRTRRFWSDLQAENGSVFVSLIPRSTPSQYRGLRSTYA